MRNKVNSLIVDNEFYRLKKEVLKSLDELSHPLDRTFIIYSGEKITIQYEIIHNEETGILYPIKPPFIVSREFL